MRKRTLLLAATLTTGLLAALPAGQATAAPAGPTTDFNGDGYGDVALAAPYAKVGGKGMAGYVAVLYGTKNGLDPAKRTVLSQNTTGVPGTAETEDTFGEALAIADLNKDGYSDLAVGAPGEDVGTDVDGGSVTVLWGSASGVKGGTAVKDIAASTHDNWGRLLTTGDFNGDARADLVVGTGGTRSYVLRGGFTRSGGTSGLVEKIGLPETAYALDAMKAGDTDGDKKSDLVLTYRTHNTSHASGSWSKGVAYLGSSDGVDSSSPRPLNGGTSIALGDIDGDGYDEIALGNVFSEEDDQTGSLGGKVVVIRGSAGGPVNGDAPMAVLTQDTEGVPGTEKANDGFGASVSIGDRGNDGYGDLAIGIPFKDDSGVEDSGSSVVLPGPRLSGGRAISQSTYDVPGVAEATDYFGSDILLADVNGDHRADLTVAAGFENNGAGAVWALRAGTSGISTAGVRSFGPGSLGMTSGYGAFGAGLTG
ncbi:FG-GAP repeat protein [Streptomyces sp. RG80]|uniref:FG-GAP repeat protein n=1 Tax=Streptomyces sp. RG80 TaxID=3157340 RepID=UPI00338F1AAE